MCQPSGTRDLYRAAPGWAACRVRSRKGYRQAAWNEASRGSDGGGADTASDRGGTRIRSRHVVYFDAITNNYRSSTAGNHRISGLGSNSPNTPNGLSPYLLPIKEQAAPCVRPCPAMLHPGLSEGRSGRKRPEFTAGRSIWRDNRQLRRPRRPRQEKTPWQLMQS